MPRVVVTYLIEDFHEYVQVDRAPKDLSESDLSPDQVVVEIPSSLFNDFMRVAKRKESLEERLKAIWTHARKVGNGHRYG